MKTKPTKTKLLTALLALCMLLLVPVSISALAADTTVGNEAELETALENADCAVIKLGSNIETTWELNVERTVTLDLNGYTVSCSLTDEDIIRVRSSGNLTIKDSGTGGKIDGQNKNSGFNVKGGTLVLESGSIVNCKTGGDGGAVDVSNSSVTETPVKYGKFVMNGGAITDCKADDDAGAVDIGSGCTFIMNGGTISGCRADDDGGAVFIKQSGTFELNGGVIQNCSAGCNGGAVNIYKDGRFTMTGGTIKDCKVDLGGYGNAVYGEDDKAIVAISGGTIENCGVKPWYFDAYTVTFDSDGGSAVAEQKLRNAPAVKPADPKKDGYDFAGWYLGEMQYTFDSNVAANITLKAHWTPASAPTVIDVVEINGVTVSFKGGDKPVFTGKTPDGANYSYRCEWWELDSKTGAMSTDFGNFYENKFTAFEAGKTYHYGVYVTTVYGDRHVFGPDTKLKINGEFVNYKRYEGDTSDGSDGIMWVLTDLTITPEAGGTNPPEKYTVTYTDGVADEEIFKDQTYTVESGKTTPAFNGTPARKGYTFAGWKPEVAATVTGNVTYEAAWKSDKASGDNTGETTSPETGDTGNMVLWAALLFVGCGAAIVATAVIRKKKHNG